MTHHFMEKLRVCTLCSSLPTHKREMCFLCIPPLLIPGRYNPWRARGRETRPPRIRGWRRVTFQTKPYAVFLVMQAYHEAHTKKITISSDFHTHWIEIPEAWVTTIRHRLWCLIVVTFMSLSLLLSALKYVVEKCWTVLFNNNKGISRVVFTRGYNWNNDVKMPLVKLSDINW